MEPFEHHTGIAAPLMQINIDTDAIIPSREMKSVSKKGLEDGLFAEWRYLSLTTRKENPEFVLNQDPYRSASLLLTGENFGCGSSREHAAWALYQWGIRVIVAPSFGSIFYNNCIQNGILPVVLGPEKIKELQTFVELNPAVNQLTVDLRATIISAGSNICYPFSIEPSDQQNLLQGLDAIGSTLKMMSSIEAFEENDIHRRPWVYL
ncbi:MAG: 3-isopropylmalate dehydratase small subunit [Gammaproteobacteria bacterium]|jgi:3-isopropylmalate/(R)-2-methylmalate dehydratase small subunit